MQHPSLSLIIPCFNEQVRIANMWTGITEFIKVWQGILQVIIVNDGSTDDTEKLIIDNPDYQKLLAQNKIIYVAQKNGGKGAALQNGIALANTDFLLTLDADMATAPTEIIKWLQINENIFEKNTIAIASRTLPQSNLVLISARRKTGNVFNSLVRVFTGLPFRDTQCGFKLYPTAIAKKLFLNLKTLGWAHDVEVLKKAVALDYKIVEMPITWNERDASKINVLRDGIKMLWDVIVKQ